MVELTVSMVVTGILLISLFGITTYYLAMITRSNMIVEMTVDSQNLLRASVEELRYGAGVRQTNAINDTNSPPGGWNTSNTDFIIIIAVPAINASRDYIIDADTGSPYNNELVYFKEGTTLFKRTLAHPDAADNSLKTSCPESSANAGCPADKKLTQFLNSMVFTLYDQDDGVITDPLLARSVKINLGLEQDTFGDPLTLDNSIRITLRNSF